MSSILSLRYISQHLLSSSLFTLSCLSSLFSSTSFLSLSSLSFLSLLYSFRIRSSIIWQDKEKNLTYLIFYFCTNSSAMGTWKATETVSRRRSQLVASLKCNSRSMTSSSAIAKSRAPLSCRRQRAVSPDSTPWSPFGTSVPVTYEACHRSRRS